MTEVLVGSAYAEMQLRYEQFAKGASIVEQQLKRLQDLAKQPIVAGARFGGASGSGSGGGGRSGSLDADYARQQRAVASLEAAQARLAAAQGDGAGQAALYAQSQQRLFTLLEKGNLTFDQTIGAQRQLASVQTAAAKAGSTAASYAEQFGGALTSSLLSIAGPAAAAAAALGGVSKAFEAGRASLALDRQLRVTRELAGSTGAYNRIIAEAREQQLRYGGSLEQNVAGLQGLVVTARSTGAELQTLLDLSQRLSVLDPAQGAEGARIALSEVLSGDPRSLARRYEIPLSALEKIKDESVPVAERLAVLDRYLAKIGITSAVVDKAVSAEARTFNEYSAAVDTITTRLGRLAVLSAAPFAKAGAGILGGGFAKDSKQGLIDGAIGAQTYLRALQGLPPVSAEVEAGQRRQADAVFRGWNEFLRAFGIVEQYTPAIQRAADADDRAAQSSGNLTGALNKELQEKIAGQQATAQLSQLQAQLEADSRLAARGLLGAGDQATLLAQKYGIAAGQAAFLIQQQQAITNAAALQSQRAGERSPGASGLAEEEAQTARLFFKLQQQAAAEAAAEQKRIADAQYQYQLTAATNSAQRIALIKQRLAQTTDKAERLALEAQIIQEQRSGQGRVSGAVTTARQLANVEQNSGLELARIQRENLQRLADQQEDFDVRRTRSREDFERRRRELLARGQRAEAARLAADFARDAQREQEDFDRQRRRTLRDNTERSGDRTATADLRSQQIRARAGDRGIAVGGAADTRSPTISGPSPRAAGGGGAGGGGTFLLQVQIAPQPILLDGKVIGEATWPTIEQLVDAELAAELGQIAIAIPANSSQIAVAGGRP